MINELANIVKEVGALLLNWREAKAADGEWVGAQFKSKADIMAHEALTERLEKLEPGLPIMSEEAEDSWFQKRPDTYWIIDPIDGTASYAQGFKGFVTQVALMEKNKPILSAIYAPALEQLYIAERDEKVTLNGRRLNLSTRRRKTGSILIDNYPEPHGITSSVYQELGFTKYIECGSISLKICKVADGTADLFFKDVPVRDWDLAAPHLIIEEAEGYLYDINGEEFKYTGNHEHNGLVAAQTENGAMKLLSWYKQRVDFRLKNLERI
ncbi:MAG: inositol monophosphatase [Proteobacteria bacterium]|nr:inositol monophosphatase [Desulfobacteraceae bacterium]MBU4013879.1 inositol monophosphatase [Pseudomonadota bacterium]MBU4068188.1 inositol monophosphatase [Pseudomonadota bacterium]MBU4128242.1 inositol monophosphatase [Pseudomonadota bacterium]